MINDLKNQLDITIKAFEREGKPVPADLLSQKVILQDLQKAIADNDDMGALLAFGDLLGGGTFIA